MVEPLQATAAPITATRWNVLAIVSLVTSIVGISLLGVVCGHIALVQLRRSGENGTSLAIAGLVVGYLGVLLWILFWVVAISTWGVFSGVPTY